jgi:hypothetical protein
LERPTVVEATEDIAEAMVEAVMGDSVMATAMAFLGDLDMIGGVILTGGTTPTIPTTILTIIPTTILITMGVMGNRRCLRRQNRHNSNLLFGASVRTQKVTTLTSKIAAGVG